MTDPWILYTEEMGQVDGWFFGADIELFSELLACQRAEDIQGDLLEIGAYQSENAHWRECVKATLLGGPTCRRQAASSTRLIVT